MPSRRACPPSEPPGGSAPKQSALQRLRAWGSRKLPKQGSSKGSSSGDAALGDVALKVEAEPSPPPAQRTAGKRQQQNLTPEQQAARDAAAAKRKATNSTVQGSAADLIKQAMIGVDGALKRDNHPARMLLQIHDELVFEAPTAEVDEVVALAESAMRQAMPLRVPVVVETAVGADWLEAH